MATEILLPQLGFAAGEAVLAQWLVEDGAVVSKGQLLYSLESEKTVTEIEAPEAGTVRIRAAAGGTYPVGTLLAEIE